MKNLSKYSEALKTYLVRLMDGSITDQNSSHLVQIARSIAQAHFANHYFSLLTLCLHQGLTTTDLSYDCIAEAFSRNQENEYPQLKKFVSSLNAALSETPATEVFMAFRSFITRLSDAQLARLYAQADPFGARIQRNIRDCVQRSSQFTLRRDSRGLILFPRSIDSLDHLPKYPSEELTLQFLANARTQQTTGELLNILFTILCDQNNYRRSLPLADVVQLFKQVYTNEFDYPARELEQFHFDGLLDFEIETITAQVQMTIKEKILLTYLARDKINRTEAKAIADAFSDVLADFCSSGALQSSLFEYLRTYLAVEEERFEQDYRGKMEYLLKEARTELAARLMREL